MQTDIERARWWAGEPACDALSTFEHSAVVSVALRSTTGHSCKPLVGLRRRRRLALPLLLQRVRVSRRQLDCYVARDSGYIAIAFIFDGSDARSAARERKTIVRQNVTFPQIPAS